MVHLFRAFPAFASCFLALFTLTPCTASEPVEPTNGPQPQASDQQVADQQGADQPADKRILSKESIDEQLAAGLDRIVREAEKKARPNLPHKVTTAEQALRHEPAKYAGQYCVVDYKDWWIVAWCGQEGSKPWLWLPGFAIRKNSQDYYGFGSW